MAKYYKSQDKKPAEIRKALKELCEEKIEHYNEVKYFQVINRSVEQSKKSENVLVDVGEISFNEDELKFIDGLDVDVIHKKVLFSILCINKIKAKAREIRTGTYRVSEYFGKNNNDYKYLKDNCNIPVNRKKGTKNIHDIIGGLAVLGYVDILNRGVIKLNNVPLASQEGTESDLTITNFEDFGCYYGLHVNEKSIKLCLRCDRPFQAKSNSNKYCKDCAYIVRNESQKRLMQGKRNSVSK
jgi:hypothetical protein